MRRTSEQLRDDALLIWHAGVDAVSPARLIEQSVRVDGPWLTFGDGADAVDLRAVRRIAIVGAGKAAAGMAVAMERAIGPQLLSDHQVEGWVNVPADCVDPARIGGLVDPARIGGLVDPARMAGLYGVATARIHLHAGRPAGVNEPRPEGVAGTAEILRIVASLGENDLCICLLAGGGSALLVAPVPEISLDVKIRITQLLSASGANIEQLNTVRTQLSRVKGGGLARACRAGRLVSLIISDVLGDPLEAIASGPTTPGSATAQDALEVLESLNLTSKPDARPIVDYLTGRAASAAQAAPPYDLNQSVPRQPQVTHHIIGNNATAIDAAGAEAERRGYSHAMTAATASEGPAEEVGRHLAEMAERMRREPGPDCLITGGEPVVQLADKSNRGKGGRNQQLVLAALTVLGDCRDVALLSGGTDGEDGPTDAAGAIVDEQISAAAASLDLDAADYLRRNDAYHFFEPVGGLIKTGPTHTNVCDLRVVTVAQAEE